MSTRPSRTVIVYDSRFPPPPPSASRTSPARVSPFSPAYVSPAPPAISRPSSASAGSLTTTRSPPRGCQPGPRAGVWERTAGIVRGVRDSGYDRPGLADGVPGRAGSAPVPEIRPDDECRAPPSGVPPPPSDEAHTPTPVPSATVPANAAATTARFRITCRVEPRRLCWVTVPTYDRSGTRWSPEQPETLPSG
ncbi:hypothetical protein GCM10017687_36680 [Streptomyces echinatus]